MREFRREFEQMRVAIMLDKVRRRTCHTCRLTAMLSHLVRRAANGAATPDRRRKGLARGEPLHRHRHPRPACRPSRVRKWLPWQSTRSG